MSKAQIKARIEKLEREVAYLRQLRQQHDGVTTEQAAFLTWLEGAPGRSSDNPSRNQKIISAELIKLGYAAENFLYSGSFVWQITPTGRAALEAHQASQQSAPPRCAGKCGRTDNLTECRATPDGTYLLCPDCIRDEREQQS